MSSTSGERGAADAPVGGASRLGAREIAAAIGRPPPTSEQVAVIEAPPVSFLVVAGAGSGKTDTMASRVVWLVANGLLQPRDVLGLTFTRKAAGELAERIGGRLALLAQTGLWNVADPALALSISPTISTYHAYAGRLVAEHGLRLGVEPDSRLLSDAAAWQVAHEAVTRYDGPMDGLDAAESTVTAAVVALAGELAEHLRRPEEVREFGRRVMERIDSLPRGATRARGLPREVKALRRHLNDQLAVLPVVEDYGRIKRMRDCVDFADQMALAARLAEGSPDVRAGERARYRAVLLDEFQDTSEAQLRLLHALFADPSRDSGPLIPVMAVGDPHQSIYGWRGASATTLAAFARRFASTGAGVPPIAHDAGTTGAPTDPDHRPDRQQPPGGKADAEARVPVLPLSTSWRNDSGVLAVANAVAAPLVRESAVPVERLVPAPGAGIGTVRASRCPTAEDEARVVAERVGRHWWADTARREHGGVTAAVLCRRRAQFPVIVDALRAAGLPVEVVGLGGLLTTPEVTDLVALLGVVHDPARGDLLMRLLTSPRIRLGAADLAALGTWSRQLSMRRARRAGPAGEPAADVAPGAAAGTTPAADGAAPDEPASASAPVRDVREVHEVPSLAEAVDELPPADWRGPDGDRLSATCRRRLLELGAVLREVRSLVGLALPELVAHAERAWGLDVEVAARPDTPEAAARVHLDAFVDAAADFSTSADRPTLGGFLAWLDAAREQERGLDMPLAHTNENAVQVLTVHAAKGLEWDVVAVPGLVEGAFPSYRAGASGVHGGAWRTSPPKDRGWTGGLDPLPYELRGDVAGLPTLSWRSAPDLASLDADLHEFQAACGAHQLSEERRLAYVAFTRARHALYLSASVWTDAATPRVTSRFLTDVLDLSGLVALDGWAPMPPTDEAAVNPLAADPPHTVWPPERRVARRDVVAEAARLVRSAQRRAAPGRDDRRGEPGAVGGRGVESATPGEPPRQGESAALGESSGPGETSAQEAPSAAGEPPTAQAVAEMALLDAEVDALLAERAARRRSGDDRVELPGHLSTSSVVSLARDREAFARRLRRPMPEPPATQARRGTAFHAWLEEFYGHPPLFHLDDLGELEEPATLDDEEDGPEAERADDASRPGAADEDADLARLKELFLAGPWAQRTPVEVEVNVETVIAGMPVRGRIDAVFARPEGGLVIVDWKTGRTPDEARLEGMALQLAVYRLAYCRLHGVRPDEVDVAFYFAASGETVHPRLPDDDMLVARLEELFAATGGDKAAASDEEAGGVSTRARGERDDVPRAGDDAP